MHFRFGLLQPEAHAHLAVHRVGGAEILMCLLALTRPAVELAEAVVTASHERAHAAGFGECQRLAIVSFSMFAVAMVKMGRDIT